jgi:flagellar basal body-associated protein FliL
MNLNMIVLKCEVCGAELVPATNFCRQCGSAVSDANAEKRSEAPTALFNCPPASSITQRLDPRPTGPEPGTHRPASLSAGSQSSGRQKFVIIGLVVVLIVVGVLTTFVVMRMQNANANVEASTLSYPGAATVLNMTNTDGSRTIHLQTKDPLARVESWYQSTLKLSKTVKLTSTSVVMKKDKVTITLAEEAGTTNILIKQAP